MRTIRTLNKKDTKFLVKLLVIPVSYTDRGFINRYLSLQKTIEL